MNVDQVKVFCRGLSGILESESGYPSNILTYSIAGKKFAYFKTSDPEKWRFSVRVSSGRFLELTDQPGIKPARYMQRFHWVTLVKVDDMDEEYLKELIDGSYQMAFARLPKKTQTQINNKQSS